MDVLVVGLSTLCIGEFHEFEACGGRFVGEDEDADVYGLIVGQAGVSTDFGTDGEALNLGETNGLGVELGGFVEIPWIEFIASAATPAAVGAMATP